MSVEAELKARVRNPGHVRNQLDQRAKPDASTYADRYFDYPDRRLSSAGEELRVRTITGTGGRQRAVLTYKEPAVDADSGSKPEHETAVGEAEVTTTVLTALGLQEFVSFEKRCTNYRFIAYGRELLATLVQVPELGSQTFIEVETMAERGEVDAALHVVRTVLAELGVSENDLTTETYTEAVAARRDTASHQAE